MILHEYLYEDYASMHNAHQHPYVPLGKKKNNMQPKKRMQLEEHKPTHQ
jgi:hypothetical protein